MRVTATLDYETLEEIGTGEGMNSTVYRARDPQLAAIVAVKEIEQANFGNPTDYWNEAQTMFENAHENVVAIRCACRTPDMIALLMPYYAKGSLAKRIERGPLPLGETLRVAHDVLRGLAHIHLRGFVHLDVKPSNVLFSDSEKAMVADFGQSRAISSGGVVTLPPMYRTVLPPETLATGVVTTPADVYQAGVLLYRCVNGDPHYEAQVLSDDDKLKKMIARGKFPDRRGFLPHVPKRLRTIIRTALQTDPSKRYQTANAMAAALGRMPLAMDWGAMPLPHGGMRWKAERYNQPDLVVELSNAGSGYHTGVYTDRFGKRRRVHPATFEKTLPTRDDAFAHLETVFQRLPG